MARTFQNIRLFSGMTVLENLLVAQHGPLSTASLFSIAGLLGLARYRKAEAEAIEFASYWLENIGLIERADDAAGDLAYGDQRRLEIARAMCTRPVLLCLDEPAAGLNPRESAELNRTLLWIKQEHGLSILLIEHDMGVVMGISDHIAVLDYGRKISDGSPEMRAQRSHRHRRLSRRGGRGGRKGRGRGATMSAPLLSVRGVDTFYGNIQALRSRQHRCRARRDRHADRRQRRGQDHADDDDLRLAAGAHRPDRLRRPGHHPHADA